MSCSNFLVLFLSPEWENPKIDNWEVFKMLQVDIKQSILININELACDWSENILAQLCCVGSLLMETLNQLDNIGSFMFEFGFSQKDVFVIISYLV